MNQLKIIGVVLLVSVFNIYLFSPRFIGLSIGDSALSSAIGVTVLLASILLVLFVSYQSMNQPAVRRFAKQLQTHEDFVQALQSYQSMKSFATDLAYALEQMDRWLKKDEHLRGILAQKFEPHELSFVKFASTIEQVKQFFYVNVRNMINRLQVLDASDVDGIEQRRDQLSQDMLQKRKELLFDHITFIKQSLNNNEEILLKLDQLMIEISKLDDVDADISQLPCMQEIEALIKQTKLYKETP